MKIQAFIAGVVAMVLLIYALGKRVHVQHTLTRINKLVIPPRLEWSLDL